MNTEKNKQKWIKRVTEILQIGGKSDITIEKYTYAIKRFLESFSESAKISNFKEKEILEYLKKEFINKGLSPKTYNFNLSAIKCFYRICFEKTLSTTTLPTAKIGKRLPKIIDKSTFISIVNNETNLEHKCWLLLGFCSGLRSFEVAKIKIEDIDSKNHKLNVIGKGDKERYTFIPDITIKLLRLFYQEKHMTNKTGYLFPGTKGHEHISERTISNYFTDLVTKLGLPEGITFHSLRHSFATYFLMNGGNQFVLKDLLGHSSLSSTAIYVHLAKDFNHLEGIRY